MIRDKRIALVFRAASLLLAAVGLLSMTGVFRGAAHPGILVYYTTQSNILAIVLFGMLTVRTAVSLHKEEGGGAGFFSRFEMVCVIDIMLTFVVFWSLLAPAMFTMTDVYNLWSFDNLAVHGITPLLCLLDYVMFSQPRHLKYRDVFYVAVFPLVYVAATSLAGILGYVYRISAVDGLPERFPYFFYDFDRLGAASLLYIGAMVAFFLVVAHGFYFVDTRIRK